MSKSSRRSTNKNTDWTKRWRQQVWRNPRYLVSLLLVVVIVAFGGYSLTHYSHAATSPGVTVSGNQFMLNGKSFIPQGFISLALSYYPGCTLPRTTPAAQNFGPTELGNLKKKWHSNTVRFNVALAALTGPNAVAYAHQVQKDVDTVRSAGLVVTLDMQDEIEACGNSIPLPSQQTEDAWTTLIDNTQLKDDPYVMFEVMNEPQNSSNPAQSTKSTVWNWPDWLNGGRQISDPAPNKHGQSFQPYTPIGHQQLVDYMRNTLHITNVIIVDGAAVSETLKNVPAIKDPETVNGQPQVAYAVHPFDYWQSNASAWDLRWGNFAKTHPVVLSAWSCNPGATSAVIATFLQYERNMKEGIIGYPLDVFDSSGHYAWRFMKDTALDPNTCGVEYQKDYTNYFAPSQPHIKRRPTKPGNLHLDVATTNSLTVTWNASTGQAQLMMYRVRLNGKLVTTTTNVTSYTASDLQPGTSYTFEVRATDGPADFSNPAMLTATTLSKPIVLPPRSHKSVPPIVITSKDGDGTGVPIPPGVHPVVSGVVTLSTTGTSGTATVKVDGTTVSKNGTLNTTYLTNGEHTVTLTTSAGGTSTQIIDVANHLNPWQTTRNHLFSPLRGDPALMNGSFWGSIAIVILLIGTLGLRYKHSRFSYGSSSSRKR